ncbi:protein NRT1/ PTR FAMILY 8.2-like [Cynara cardunculus var. scolymus]|uniref:protein NRT1/ PTR FAMILY 8.2-like n=1 Tax=Cynara cardunculus var. scolymus TaxID=59895 RepID=UPI000D62BDDB|nr:protein NRT1/ PTR FAMILY 8.2-like [Cynara cardunculus var. scolymus]
MGRKSQTGDYREVDTESSTCNLLESKEEDGIYTEDGTVDYLNNPANKEKTGTWKACGFILGNECCERLAFYGMSSNLVRYFKYHLNEHSATASRNLSTWTGTCYLTPLIGAFVADTYIGRYWTIASFSIIYAIGMAMLTLSASVPGLKPTCYENDVCSATEAQIALCFTSLYLVSLGTGGIKPCVSSYGADQFDDHDEVEEKQKSSFFNWFYFVINIGALVAHSVLVWIQDNVGWGWGFLVPTVAMAIAVVSFFSGTKLYRNQIPGGSPLTRLCQVVVASFRKKRIEVPSDSSLLYEASDAGLSNSGIHKIDHTLDFLFLDKAAVVLSSDHRNGSIDPWKLCSGSQVEELKAVLRLLPIWATGIIFCTVYAQMSNLFVLQGSTLDPRVGTSSFEIPPASLGIFDTISVIFWVPVYDCVIVHVARRLTGQQNGLTQLQRIGTGLFISIFSMVCAGILEVVRLEIVSRNNYYELDRIPMSIFWQVPQYFLMGCAEVFTFIGQLEFFYEQAPDSMRSLCAALQLTITALGNYLSAFLVTIVTVISTQGGSPGWITDNLNYGHLDYFFWLLAGLSVVNLGVFITLAKRHTYKIPAGAVR